MDGVEVQSLGLERHHSLLTRQWRLAGPRGRRGSALLPLTGRQRKTGLVDCALAAAEAEAGEADAEKGKCGGLGYG
jgi:hypothetical protein